MQKAEKNKELSKLGFLFLLIAFGVTGIILISLFWSKDRIYNNSLQVARIQALASFEEDIIYRRWNSSLGGLFTWSTEKLQPNPYLDVEDRDLKLEDGRILTLVNPAYMTRMVHEIHNSKSGIKGHITSLNPIRPLNVADKWETVALEKFEQGASEFSSLEEMAGEQHFRFMKPLMVEESCLKCHAKQGYKLGQIRGGISVSLPMEGINKIMKAEQNSSVFIHLLFLIASLAGLMISYQSIHQGMLLKQQAEEQLKFANENLKEANSELESFTYTVSHDLRTPLRHINGFSEILMKRVQEEGCTDTEDILSKILKATDRMDQLIEDLFNLSLMQSKELEIQKCDLAEIARSVIETLKTSEPERQINFEVEETLTVSCDIKLIKIALENLLGNSWKFCSRQEKTEISMGEKPGENGERNFYIRDNGAGFNPAFIDKLFQPFQRLHSGSEFSGTGVGLATVSRIIHRHGGRIWAESQEGQGATFYFTLGESGVSGVVPGTK